jgi:hypothetical protein
MHRHRCPEAFWCYGLSYTKEIRQLLARPNLDWRTPIEVMTGETPDNSEYTNFDFYGWVKYKDPNNGLSDDVILWGWLGVAHSVGQAMTYWVLKSNGYLIARSTVRPITAEEMRSEPERIARESFMTEITSHVEDFDPDCIHTDLDNAPDEMTEPFYVNHNDNEQDPPVLTSHSSEVPGPEPLRNAQVYLAHGDRYEIAKVIGRKRDSDGLFVGRKHSNPSLDSRIFVAEFPDGKQKDVAYNLIAEHLFSQIDSECNQYRLFKEIINHRKGKMAVDKADQFRIDKRTGKQVMKQTTAGWELEVEWKDGSTSWLPLKELKETNIVNTSTT